MFVGVVEVTSRTDLDDDNSFVGQMRISVSVLIVRVAHVQQLVAVLHQLRPGHAAVVVNDDAAARGQGIVVHLDGGYGGSLSGPKKML